MSNASRELHGGLETEYFELELQRYRRETSTARTNMGPREAAGHRSGPVAVFLMVFGRRARCRWAVEDQLYW